jgi:outer membrane protein TolC
MSLSQKFPWFGKLRTQAETAEAEANIARAELAATELTVTEQVKRAYYELYVLERAIQITEEDRQLLVDLTQVVDRSLRAGRAAQQDVLRAQLEVLNLDGELVRLRQERQSAQARLARLLHLSPDTELSTLDHLPEQQIPGNLQQLYERAVAARPELRAQLAAIARDRRKVDLARLGYFPDLTASVDWSEMTRSRALSPVADGLDDIGIGLMVNLPIYRSRLDAAVCEAEATTIASARRYESLRDETLENVKDLFVQVESQRDLVNLFRNDIIPKAEQTLRSSIADYEVAKIGFLQLVDNWRQLLKFQVTAYRQEAQLWQTLATLERTVGGRLDSPASEEIRGMMPGQAVPEAEPSESPALPAS